MLSVFICRATSSDADLIASLSRTTFYQTFASQNTQADLDKFLNEQFTYQALAEEVRDANNIFFLAFNNSQPVGYLFLRSRTSYSAFERRSSLELARIYVDDAAKGTGVGTALMKTAIEQAKKLNKEILWLGVWEKNEKAIAFYKKWGFEKFGEHDFVLGNDVQNDWLMMKLLDEK
ncbi:MAG: GNAT family N-acetyltransferase [Chitinophagaceae bacterium]